MNGNYFDNVALLSYCVATSIHLMCYLGICVSTCLVCQDYGFVNVLFVD